MDIGTSRKHGVLERIVLDENAEPTDLPLSLLEDITNQFSPDHQIGSGGSAVVYKGMVGAGMVAVKKLYRTYDIVHEEKFHKEVECLMKARHKNIVRFLGYCSEAHGKAADYKGKFVMADSRNWLLCFEYVPNGNLQRYITDASSGLEWSERFGIIKGISEGLYYLHMNRILHLDLKPANILLDRHLIPKITDFGLSRFLSEEKTHENTNHTFGTPGYMAPELIGGQISFPSDIYSLGVIIMEILTGVKRYLMDDNVIESWANRLEGDKQLEQVTACIKIGMECMESDPKKRPVAQSIIDMLDKTAVADETGSSSLVELELGLLKEKFDQERNGKLAERLGQVNIKEHPETIDLENDQTQQGEENTAHWSLWEAQDTERKVDHKGKNIVLSVLGKLNIFRRGGADSRRNFLRNGGQVLQNVQGLRIFTKREIKKITRNYSEMIAEGSFARVYIGTLPDYTRVIVKTYSNVHLNKPEVFVNRMQIHANMVHENILKLVGCCLETDIPMSVHEYAANGNLQQILHGDKNKMIPLDLRLDIAIGSAEGLRYIHSRGMQHGDVKPDNILFNERLTPKISDLQLSQSLTVNTAYTTYVAVRMHHIDPMYLLTGHLTQKSDVYSFGAVLLEIISRKKFDYSEYSKYRKCYEIDKTGRAVFDKNITAEENIFVLEEISKLAIECIKEDIEERPDMTEVTERLVMLRRDRRLGKDAIMTSPSHFEGI